MSEVIKYAALGVVGFVAYEYFIKPALTPVTVALAPASNINPNKAGSNGITNINIGILQKLFNKVGGNTTLYTYDQWNYYYNQITGSYAQSWENTALSSNGVDRGKPLTAQDFLTVNSLDAMSGLGRYMYVSTN